MAKPGVPTPTQLSVSKGFTVGIPDKKPKTQTTALSPLVGGLQRATLPIVCGVDAQSGSIPYAGGTVSFTIPLPNFPAPFTVGPSDQAQFLVALSSFAFPVGTSDAAVSVTLTPQALNGTTPIVTGPGGILRQGTTYTGWQVLVSAAAALGTSGTLTVAVSAWLYDTLLTQ